MKRLLFSLLVLCSVVAWGQGLENLTVNGATRTMIVHAPAGLGESPALVIACHGANQDANYHSTVNSAWIEVSDREKFVVVFPNGENKFWDISGNKDIDFVLAIIKEMESRYGINTNRVYMTGFSMGGMFTYHCANRIADRIAAFVPVSGYPMGEKIAASSRPVPILHCHGTGDDVCVFSGVQPTLDAWIKRNGCNTTPVTTRPYPVGNPNANTTRTDWLDGENGVEVSLLAFDGKGHWQCEDKAFARVSDEGWAFMNRWSLGPDAPKVASVEPEDGSFDLPQSGLDITLSFDEAVETDGVTAVLAGASTSCELEVSASGHDMTLSMPAGVTLPKGSYTLTVENVKGESGGVMKKFTCGYVIGIEEVGEQLAVKTVFEPDLRATQGSVGEGIPAGWYRCNSRANGEKDEKEQNSANTGGARMKYFLEGGDFSEGFYLSARDYDKCEITYGRYDGYRLHLVPGKYTVNFNSIFWNKGSLDGKVTFDFTVAGIDGSPVTRFGSLASTGNLDENSGRTIEGSTLHAYEFEIPTEGDYLVSYTMTSGWAAVIVGGLKITTSASAADIYKGGFLRAMAAAVKLYGSIAPEYLELQEVVNLKSVIDAYEGFTSTSPSRYEAATAEVLAAIEAVNASVAGVDDVVADGEQPVSVEYYDLSGRRLSGRPEGIGIACYRYLSGRVVTKKIVSE